MLPNFLKDFFQYVQSTGISPVCAFWCVLGYQSEIDTFHTVDSWILTLCESMPMSNSLGYKNDTLFVVSGT